MSTKYLCLFLIIFLGACQSEAPNNGQNQETVTKKEFDLVTQEAGLQLYQQPGGDGVAMEALEKGTRLTDLGEVSPFLTDIELQGETFQLPWIKVETVDKQAGWVMASPVHLKSLGAETFDQILQQRQFRAILGESLYAQLEDYKTALKNADSQEKVAVVFTQLESLRDPMVKMLDQKINDRTTALPDLFWMAEKIPGLVPSLVAEGTAYYLFLDYAAFMELAKQTTGPIDDDFFELMISIYPEEGIEYFYPGWFMQTWDYGGHSLLGRGEHFRVLAAINQQLEAGSPFQSSLLEVQSKIVEDITGSEITYWETKEKITEELEKIVLADFESIEKAQKVSLKTRLEQFEKPEEYNIQVNHQAGIYE